MLVQKPWPLQTRAASVEDLFFRLVSAKFEVEEVPHTRHHPECVTLQIEPEPSCSVIVLRLLSTHGLVFPPPPPPYFKAFCGPHPTEDDETVCESVRMCVSLFLPLMNFELLLFWNMSQ